MGKESNSKLDYVIILLLFANTLFLGGIFYSIQACKVGCTWGQGGAAKVCPWSKGSAGSQKGSMGSQKGSM